MTRLGDQCTAEELDRLCDPDRYRNWKSLAHVLLRPPNAQPELVIAEVLKRQPDSDETRVRRYVKRLLATRRGRGAPRSYTDAEATEVRRLRDTEGLSWAKIGERMGWPVHLTRSGKPSDSPRARNAYQFALAHNL